MRILVACEESQIVVKAFRAKGHQAYSCDLLECSGGHPEWHYQCDAIELAYDGGYDMMIAHPPCTYLSNVANRVLRPGGILNPERFAKGMEAKAFFIKLLNAPIEKIAIENPVQSKVFEMPLHSQTLCPSWFGSPYRKKTRLWLKNLPPLMATLIVERPESTKVLGNWYNKGGKERQKNRSKTFQGMADAMAEQWG